MPGVLVEGEAELVRVEHPAQQLVAHRERAEDFGGREGGVEIEPDAGGGQLADEEGGQQEKVKVLDPDEIARRQRLHLRSIDDNVKYKKEDNRSSGF